MNLELTDLQELTGHLKQAAMEPGRLIVFDGVLDAGQKALADALANELGLRRRSAVVGEDVAALRGDILSLQEAGGVIVDGVMMRAVIAAAGLDGALHVYVIPSRSNPRRGFWQGILSRPLDAYLAELKDELDQRTVRYHWQTHPIINADFLVEGA